MIRRLSIAALAALALLGLALPADAGSIWMCRPAAPGTGSAGPGQVVMQGTATTYTLDRAGCAAFIANDVGEATANGFVQSGSLRAMQISGATAATQVGVLPAGGYIVGVIVMNETANAPTNGLKFGSTSGGTDIITGILSTAYAITHATDASIAKRAFSPTQATNVFVDAVTSWNSTRQVVTVLYSFF